MVLSEFYSSHNYSNSLIPTTKIKYSIPSSVETRHDSSLQLKVYDILGNEVATLVNKNQQPGNYEVEFSGANLSSGVYFYKLKILDPETSLRQDFIQTKKMILMK